MHHGGGPVPDFHRFPLISRVIVTQYYEKIYRHKVTAYNSSEATENVKANMPKKLCFHLLSDGFLLVIRKRGI